MTKKQIRKLLGVLACKIRDKKSLSAEERSYLSNVLGCIGEGDDPAEALGLVYGVGQKEVDDHSRASRSFLFWWISCAIGPGIEKSISLAEAFREASRISQNPLYNLKPIQSSSLKKEWYSGKYEHLKKLSFNPNDGDLPIGFGG
jgi:hypothetical protein